MPIETTPASADIQFLDDRIYEFNTSTTGIDNGAFLTILVRDDAGTIVRDCTAGRGETAARSRPSGCRQIAVAKDSARGSSLPPRQRHDDAAPARSCSRRTRSRLPRSITGTGTKPSSSSRDTRPHTGSTTCASGWSPNRPRSSWDRVRCSGTGESTAADELNPGVQSSRTVGGTWQNRPLAGSARRADAPGARRTRAGGSQPDESLSSVALAGGVRAGAGAARSTVDERTSMGDASQRGAPCTLTSPSRMSYFGTRWRPRYQ